MKRIISFVMVFSCIFGLFCTSAFAAPPCNDAVSLADALYEFGLFKGTGTDSNGKPTYGLATAPTRQQAVVMLIRLLGKEDEALDCAYSHPFTDVDFWADRYIAYAYKNGLTNGTNATTFSGNQNINAQQYITLLLRSLGYNDSNGDFSYSNALAFSDSIGLTEGKYSQNSNFLREDLVWLSCGALLQPTKAGVPLVKQLKKDGALTDEQYINGLSIMAVADLSEDFRYVVVGDNTDDPDVVIDVYDLYSEPAHGEYSGYQRLRGYAYDNIYPIYYSGNSASYTYQVECTENMSELCTWTWNGNTYKNTRSDCYEFFSNTTYFQSYYSSFDPSILSASWFRSTFGETYMEWLRYRAFTFGDAGTVVKRYLEMQDGIYYYEPKDGLYPEMYFGLFNFEEAWTEQELEADWISEYELQQLANEPDLCFGIMTSSMHDWSLGVGNLVYGFYLQGIVSKELLYVYDMPETFADSDDAEGTYSNIRFKKSNGDWYFNPEDLITVGLLNNDGTINTNFVPQKYDSDNAATEFESEWISADELKSIYNFSSYWAGEEVWIWRTALIGEDGEDIKYTLTGTPKSKMEKGVTYNCIYNGHTIRVQYAAGLLFNYADLVAAGII